MFIFGFGKRFKRKRIEKERDTLLTIHKNDPNIVRRLYAGLCYLTYSSPLAPDLKAEFPLNGRCELACDSFDLITARLTAISLSWNSASSGGRWHELPPNLSRDDDKLEERWLDRYFRTTDEGDVLEKLIRVRDIISAFSSALVEPESKADQILHNQCAHLIREVMTIVEHFISINSK